LKLPYAIVTLLLMIAPISVAQGPSKVYQPSSRELMTWPVAAYDLLKPTQIEKNTSVLLRPGAPTISSAYLHWIRNYGPWDVQYISSSYWNWTLFNYGAATAATGLSESGVLGLHNAGRWFGENAPSDEPLINAYVQHKSEFETLIRMAQSDKHLTRVASDFTWLEGNYGWPRRDIGLSVERWKQYISLFQLIGLQEGWLRSADFPGGVFFIARARGLCAGGSSEGYFYALTTPAPLTNGDMNDALEQAHAASKDHGRTFVFKHLAGDWYLFHQGT
jgi:hypothetical protein